MIEIKGKVLNSNQTVDVIVDDQGRLLLGGVPNYLSDKDISFVVGESPRVIDVNTAISRNSTRGFIICDGPGDMDIAFSHDGSIYGDTLTLKSGEVLNLDGLSINKIQLTHVADSAYRLKAF